MTKVDLVIDIPWKSYVHTTETHMIASLLIAIKCERYILDKHNTFLPGLLVFNTYKINMKSIHT